ncbi:MAG: Flp pilus assembly protein CpaB [Caldilineales bacterium]|nr:Flp pilus assembly protein CpaB [Caldilineales bacterium]
MSKKSVFWWLAAALLAVLAGYFTYFSLVRVVPAATGKAEATNPVVVALTAIPSRRSIAPEELQIKFLPASAVPPGAAFAVDQVIGKMSNTNLYEGEPIILEQLVTPDIVTQELSLSVPDGKVVMAVPMNSLLLRNRLVRPGDYIDIVGSFMLENVDAETVSRQESIAALQNMEVHAIIAPQVETEDGETAETMSGEFAGATGTSHAVLLALDIQDALVLRHILDAGGILDLLLRAPTHQGEALVMPVDSPYLAARYQIGQGVPIFSSVSAATDGQALP